MLFHQLADAVVDFVPQVVAGDGPKLLAGYFDGEIHDAFVANVDYHRVWPAVAGEKTGHGFNRFFALPKDRSARRGGR